MIFEQLYLFSSCVIKATSVLWLKTEEKKKIHLKFIDSNVEVLLNREVCFSMLLFWHKGLACVDELVRLQSRPLTKCFSTQLTHEVLHTYRTLRQAVTWCTAVSFAMSDPFGWKSTYCSHMCSPVCLLKCFSMLTFCANLRLHSLHSYSLMPLWSFMWWRRACFVFMPAKEKWNIGDPNTNFSAFTYHSRNGCNDACKPAATAWPFPHSAHKKSRMSSWTLRCSFSMSFLANDLLHLSQLWLFTPGWHNIHTQTNTDAMWKEKRLLCVVFSSSSMCNVFFS